MKLNYYPETDSLYIDLSSKPSKEGIEISEGIVLDYDEVGYITGIDLKEIVLNKVPAQFQSIMA